VSELADFVKRGASVARWHFAHLERGTMTLHLSPPADVEAVLALLARTPGTRADVRV
jgi:hypothetical protein